VARWAVQRDDRRGHHGFRKRVWEERRVRLHIGQDAHTTARGGSVGSEGTSSAFEGRAIGSEGESIGLRLEGRRWV
jgi:hypothetical protein